MSKRILHVLSLAFGSLGLFVCFAAFVAFWVLNVRLVRGTEKLFSGIDHSLTEVQEWVDRALDNVQSSKITVADIENGIKERATMEAGKQLGSQLGIQEKLDRLTEGLQRTDHWLEFTESLVQSLQQTFDIAGSMGIPLQTNGTEGLLEDLGALRVRLSDVIEPVESIRHRSTEARDNGLGKNELGSVTEVTLRVMATLSSIDSRLDALRERLSEIQIGMKTAKAKSRWWIRITTIGITLFIVWMAAGQGSLGVLGWKWLRRR